MLSYIIETYINGNRFHAQQEFLYFNKVFTREDYEYAFDLFGKDKVIDIVLNLKTIRYK